MISFLLNLTRAICNLQELFLINIGFSSIDPEGKCYGIRGGGTRLKKNKKK